jgi:uncharacterized lipoprotein YajG
MKKQLKSLCAIALAALTLTACGKKEVVPQVAEPVPAPTPEPVQESAGVIQHKLGGRIAYEFKLSNGVTCVTRGDAITCGWPR